MTKITFGGEAVGVNGKIPEVGEKAEDFSFVKEDLSDGSLGDYDGKVKVIIAIPSIETGVCQKETRVFNEQLDALENVVGLVISKDLPFALKRFCEAEGLKEVIAISDFRYNDFGNQYHVELSDLAFKGLFARVVFVVDQNNNIAYREVVEEIGHEPNYEAAMAAVKELV